jgi:hypothetical protein
LTLGEVIAADGPVEPRAGRLGGEVALQQISPCC